MFLYIKECAVVCFIVWSTFVTFCFYEKCYTTKVWFTDWFTWHKLIHIAMVREMNRRIHIHNLSNVKWWEHLKNNLFLVWNSSTDPQCLSNWWCRILPWKKLHFNHLQQYIFTFNTFVIKYSYIGYLHLGLQLIIIFMID